MLRNEQLALKHVSLPVLASLMILGNGALVLVILSHKNLRTVTNLFIASLALTDLLTGLVSVPLVVMAEKGQLGHSQYTCLSIYCFIAAQILASCLTLVAIAVERFMAVVCPLRHHTLSTTHNACVVILACWVYAAVIGALPLVGWNRIGATDTPLNGSVSSVSERNTTLQSPFEECRFEKVVGASYIAFLYPGHMLSMWIIMCVLYFQVYLRSRGRALESSVQSVSVYHNVRRLSVTMTNFAGNSDVMELTVGKTARARENWRAMRVLTVLVGYFLLSWLPVVIWYSTLLYSMSVDSSGDVDPPLPIWFYNITITLGYGNSAVNPFLYGFGNRSVRRCVLQIVGKVRARLTGNSANPDAAPRAAIEER